MIAFIFILHHVFSVYFFSGHSGGARCWMLSMLPLDGHIPRHGLRVDFYVGRLFSTFIFLISCWLTLASPFSFYGWSAECCRYVLQFSCWDCVSGYCRLYLLSWLHVYMHHLSDFIWSMLSVLLTRSMCYINSCNEGFRRIRTRRLTARPLLIFDFSSGYLVPIDYFSLRHLGGSSCSWGFSTSYLVVLGAPVLGGSQLLYLVVVLKISLPAWGSLFWSLRLLGERHIVFHFPRFQFRDVAQGSDRMIRLYSSSGALISSQAFIFGPSFVSETGLLSL